MIINNVILLRKLHYKCICGLKIGGFKVVISILTTSAFINITDHFIQNADGWGNTQLRIVLYLMYDVRSIVFPI